MAEWIGVGITILLFITAIIGFFRRETQRQVEQDGRDNALDIKLENLKDMVELKIDDVKNDMKEVKETLGNGHGLRHTVQEMQTFCAGEMATVNGEIKEIRTRLSAQQHEIDEIKAPGG